MTIEDIKQNNLLLLECTSGSRAYGLSTPQSDTDIKGVFIYPKKIFYGFGQPEQINNDSNDEVYYEVKRFIDLLVKNNPNILELLATPADCLRFRHPIMDLLKPEMFISKLCRQTFAGYAQSQIKKAKGLNKKIVNPLKKEQKSILDFCFVVQEQGSVHLTQWLENKGFAQEECGLVNIPHLRDGYALFHNSQSSTGNMRGICSGVAANDVLLSSVEKHLKPLAIMSFNKDGYSKYCRDYKEYWEWVANRNSARYENTLMHGKKYDSKNMMHTFRLLHMAEEIAREGKVNVRRPDREFLLKIKSGGFEYDTLLDMANEKLLQINDLYDKCSLPEAPDITAAENILIHIRETLYIGFHNSDQ